MTPAAQNIALSRAAEPAGAADDDRTLVETVGEAAVLYASQHLIVRHRLGQRFEIEVLDVPHAALASIGEQLEEAGVSHALSEPFVNALRAYIMKNGGAFSRAANAKPVRIHMVVADRMPKSRFDNAMTELACLGPHEVKVEGATRVNVRATPSGTATSSNAADVDAMFSQVRGLFLWVRFEAPTKEDLDGLMSAIESTLSGVAQSVGGAMGAGDFKKLLEALQKDGAMTPAVTALVNKLIQIQQATGKDGKIALHAAELAALLKDIGAMMDKAQGLVPPALADAVMRSMADMAAANPAIMEFLTERGYAPMAADNDNISVEERLDAIMEKLTALAALDGLDPALTAELTEMLEKAQADLRAGDVTPAALLDGLAEKLSAMAARGDMPQALMDGIGDILPDIESLRDSPQVAGAAADLAQGEALLALLEDIAAQIEKGEVDIDALPPEIKALIEKMGGVETLMQKEGREARAEALAEAMTEKSASELSVAVHAAVLALSDPAALATLPPSVSVLAEQFVADHPAMVERAAAQGVMRTDAPSSAIDVVADVSAPPPPSTLPVAGLAAAAPAAEGGSAPITPSTPSTQSAPPPPPSNDTTAPVPPSDNAPPAPPQPQPQQQPQKQDAPVRIDPEHKAIPVLIQHMEKILAQGGQSLPLQAQKIYATIIKDQIDRITKGEPVTADKVNETLRQIDTIIDKEKDPVKKQELIEARKDFVVMTRGVPGVDPKLQAGPGLGKCNPCTCPPKNAFLAVAAHGPVSPEIVQEARAHFETLKKDNPGGPDVRVHDDGRVTITQVDRNGNVVTKETTLQVIAQNQLENEAIKEDWTKKGLADNTTPIKNLLSDLGKGEDIAKIFGHVCGTGCKHGEPPDPGTMTHTEATKKASKIDRSLLRGMARQPK